MTPTRILATLATLLCAALFSWWIKGDWEMGWLIWMPVTPLAGAAFGLLAATALREPAAPFSLLGALAAGLCLWASISTPHRWPAPDRAPAERLAAALADSTAMIEARARDVLAAGVEVAGARTTVRGGSMVKQPFAMTPEWERARARIDVDFTLGPARPLGLWLEGETLEPDPATLDSVRTAPWVIRAPALEARFDAQSIRVGGQGPWAVGDMVPVRLERGGSDWTLLVVRVGGRAGLETLREVSGVSSRAGLGRAAEAAGQPVRDVHIYFTPNLRGTSYERAAGFDFIGVPVDRRTPLRLTARLAGETFEYSVESWR